jgi:hypothetical protein
MRALAVVQALGLMRVLMAAWSQELVLPDRLNDM